LAEVNSALAEYGVRPFKRAVLIANKADLAEEAGYAVEPGGMAEALGVEGFDVVSALRDSPERLLAIIGKSLGIGIPAGGI
jgi:hypothetical protein